MSSISCTIKTARAIDEVVQASGEDQCRELARILGSIASGCVDGAVDVAVSSANPAAATNTLTFVSVSDGDTASVGGVVFTAKAEVAEVQTLTCAAAASCVAGDYIVLEDAAGLTWAVAIDTTGSDPAPTGAKWVAVNASRKVQADISGDTTAAQVAATVEAALNGLSGFSSAFTTDDTAADGTMTVTCAAVGNVTAPDAQQDDDAGAGTSITGTTTTAGLSAAQMTEAQFNISGGTDTLDAAAFVAKVNAHSTVSDHVVASNVAGVVTLTARQKGSLGNLIALAETGTTITIGGSGLALEGGTGGGAGTVTSFTMGSV